MRDPGTQHGFHADYREVYDESAAKDGWARMKRFCGENGGRPSGQGATGTVRPSTCVK